MILIPEQYIKNKVIYYFSNPYTNAHNSDIKFLYRIDNGIPIAEEKKGYLIDLEKKNKYRIPWK